MLEQATAENKEVVLIGDLNCNWLISNKLTNDLKLTTGDNNLEQLIVDPTRITNSSKTLIDLLFATNPSRFSGAGSVGFTGSDHLMIYGKRKEKITVKPKTIVVRSFKNCDRYALLEDLGNAPWGVMETFSTIDEMWDYWKLLFLETMPHL